MDLNLQSNLFLYEGKVGDYYLSGGKKVEITKRTNKRIYLSSGVIISIKKLTNNFIYLDSKSVIRNNRSYPIVHQVLRDIEGYLLYRIHSKSFI
jgi:hypothetical protein